MEAARPQYELYETRNNLIFGIAAALTADIKAYGDEEPLLAVVWNDQGNVSFSALMTPPNPVIVQSEVDDDEAVGLFCTAALQAGWNVPGVNGPRDVSEVAAREFCRIAGKTPALREQLMAYELLRVTPPSNPGGYTRKAGPEDAEAVLSMATAMGVELNIDVHPAWTLDRIHQAIQFGAVDVWDLDGKPVSMAMRKRPTTHAVTVSNVYTLPEYRGRGFASANVAAFCRRELARGYRMINLFTDLTNPISNHVYQKLGFQPVCEYARYDFRD